MGSNASDGPLIGLTTYVDAARHGVWDELSALLPMTYVSAVGRAGAIPVLLPPTPAEPAAVLGAVSGLVITGGPDVDPALYGADRHEQTDRPRPERDAWEMALCRAALDSGLPLLAICRGMQVLNVVLGGTLHQHVPDVTGTDVHRVVPGQMTANRVMVEAPSRLAGILGTEPEGLCHHHQSVDRVGRGLHVVARTADGTIEALEADGPAFVLAVQWHPEGDEHDDRLFEALAEAATEYRSRRCR